MRKLGKRIFCVLIALLIVFSAFPFAYASENGQSNESLKKIIEETVEWKKKIENTDGKKLFASDFIQNAGKSSGDWYAIALGRIGCDEDGFSYLAVLKNEIRQRYKAKELLDFQKATEWHRVSLAVLALGGDPTDIGGESGIDLIKDGVYDRGKIKALGAQGINGPIWGLITLDSMRYNVPDDACDNRKTMISAILSGFCNGGFSLNGEEPDVDITAMALQALASYYNSEEVFTYETSNGESRAVTVRETVDEAVLWLSQNQNEDGGFSSWGQENSESCSQVILALCALGIDPVNDSRFIKNGKSTLDGLMKFRNKDGGFAHSASASGGAETESNSIAGEQALCALSALYRFRMGLRSFYDFRAEQDESLKKRISELNAGLKTVPDSKKTARTFLDKYLEIPASERNYVYNYRNLSDALAKYEITYEQSELWNCMGDGNGGNGCVIDIFSLKTVDSGIIFNENDFKEYKTLPDEPTSEHYTIIIKLYEKLKNADNSEDYSAVAAELEAKKEKVEAIRAEIADINNSVAENLYPFENIELSDKELINELIGRAEALSEYDRSQILGYDDLVRAKAKTDSAVRSVIIGASAVLLIAVLGIAAAVKIRKIRQKKRKRNEWRENDEW